MMLFVILPEVKAFCYCVSIKRGTIFVAVFYMILTGISLTVNLLGKQADLCYKGANNEMCDFYPVWEHFRYIQLFAFLFAFLVSAALILGVIFESHKVVSVFMYVITMMVVVDFLIDSYLFWIANDLPHCGLQRDVRVFCITTEIILKILFFYWIIVVKSFRSKLLHRRPIRRWRSAVALVTRRLSGARDRRHRQRKRYTQDKPTEPIIGSTSGASGSTSRPDGSVPTIEKNTLTNNEDQPNRNRAESVAEDFIDVGEPTETFTDKRYSPI